MPRVTGSYDRLVEHAAERHGYVLVRDVAEIGLRPEYLRKLAAAGRLEHCARGLYRLTAIPRTRLDEYHEAALWADGVIGGEAALALWGLADVNPRRIDVIVPSGRRTRRRAHPRFRIRYRHLGPDECDEIDNIPVVTPARAIADAIDDGTDGTLIEQALANARGRQLLGPVAEARLRVRLADRAMDRR